MVLGATLPFGAVHAYRERNTKGSLRDGIPGLLVVIKLEVRYLRHKRVSLDMITEDGVEVRSFW